MRAAVLLALCGVAACGDNGLPDGVALVATHDLVVVAHQDDDLLFMQPDVIEAVRRGAGVTNVYVTAGNGTKGADAADPRYAGLRAAYGAAAGDDAWMCGWIELAGHTAQHCRLDSANVSLVFLAYPDGGKQGEQPASLLHLWEGSIAGADTIAHKGAHYDQAGLVATLVEILRETQPRTVRTLEIAATHGRDHSDHMIVGALALLAVAQAASSAELISYRGYATSNEPVNKPDAIYNAVFPILARYEACAAGCGECGQPCTTIDATHETWLHRRYAVGFRATGGGVVHGAGGCLVTTAEGVALGDCTGAPVWRLDAAGELRTGARCLQVLAGGALALGPCVGGPDRRFLVDDEGHVWAGVTPDPAPNMDYAHLWCLTPDGAGVHAALCGADGAPVWELAPVSVATARSALGLVSTGREIRLGDLTGDGKADLCEVDAGGLRCAPGDGAGGFGAAVRVDSAIAPLSIEPRSLAIGDVDGDGLADACGRDAGGTLCATAATGFTTALWTPSFGDPEAVVGTAASLAAVDADGDGTAEVCGLAAEGVICAPHGLTLASLVRSSWPAADSVVWPADLDGDGHADWCTATDAGPACGVDAEASLSTDGVPWGFALGGVVEVAPATTATAALADIDGDGRADLCSTRDDRVLCARSQGRGFGPRTTLAILPAQSTASALWLGDLDGDGRADACADLGTTIACAVQP